jgi:hypothetical protein
MHLEAAIILRRAAPAGDITSDTDTALLALG